MVGGLAAMAHGSLLAVLGDVTFFATVATSANTAFSGPVAVLSALNEMSAWFRREEEVVVK